MAKRRKKKFSQASSAGAGISWGPSNEIWLGGLGLVAIIFIIYSPVWWAGFVWDDASIVCGNPVVTGPLGLREIWTTSAADICPLTLTSWWFVHQLSGLNPLPYHLLNVVLHGANAFLVWVVLKRLKVPGAWWGAALWGMHPVQVESVAWVSELKNTQSGLFFLSSVLFFVRWLQREPLVSKSGPRDYFLTVMFAGLAMASKSSSVVLPVILGLLAWWIDGGLRWQRLASLVPFGLLSIAAGAVTIWTQHHQLATEIGLERPETWSDRLAVAGDAIWFYLGKIIWPYPLIAPYHRWRDPAGAWFSYLPLAAAILSAIIVWLYRKRWRSLFMAAGWFAVCLMPVLGLVSNTYSHYSFVADHFQYLASMAPLALIGAGIKKLGPRVGANVSYFLGLILLVLLGFLSICQARVYQDEETFWRNTLAFDPDSWAGHNNLGLYLANHGDAAGAIEEYKKALASDPRSATSYNNMGEALLFAGRVQESIPEFQTAIQLDPYFGRFYSNLGVALVRAGKGQEAITPFQKGVQLAPDDAGAHFNFALDLFDLNRVDDAIAECRRALTINSGHFGARILLGSALERDGRFDAAIEQFREAIKLKPNDETAREYLDKAVAEKNSSPGK